MLDRVSLYAVAHDSRRHGTGHSALRLVEITGDGFVHAENVDDPAISLRDFDRAMKMAGGVIGPIAIKQGQRHLHQRYCSLRASEHDVS